MIFVVTMVRMINCNRIEHKDFRLFPISLKEMKRILADQSDWPSALAKESRLAERPDG